MSTKKLLSNEFTCINSFYLFILFLNCSLDKFSCLKRLFELNISHTYLHIANDRCIAKMHTAHRALCVFYDYTKQHLFCIYLPLNHFDPFGYETTCRISNWIRINTALPAY